MPDPGTMEVPATRAQFAQWLRTIVLVDAWLDAELSPAYRGQPLAHTCMRVTKVCAEAGEALDAFSAWTGENPRKGVCGTREDLLMELGDVAMAALCGIQHLTKDIMWTVATLEAAMMKVRHRVDGRPAEPLATAEALTEDRHDVRVAGFRDSLVAIGGQRLDGGMIDNIVALYAADISELAAQNQRYEDALAEYENAITWNTTCVSCAKLLDAAYAETIRAENAERVLADYCLVGTEPSDREALGRLVRDIWVETVLELIPDPKDSWTARWDDLHDTFQREVDMRIGERLAAAGVALAATTAGQAG
jgi:NTP pyrophosphatase (non-canonical NTP hydrolase)